MITKTVEGKHELDIFRNFIIDKGLPKYSKVKKSEFGYSDGNINVSWGNSESNFISGVNNRNSSPGFFKSIVGKFKNRYIELNKIPVELVFKHVSDNLFDLELLQGRLEKHRNAIKYAKSMGQTALVEELTKKEKTVEFEDELYSLGYTQYIPEEILIKFALDCEKGLRLDWIKNFTRIIPEDGAKIKLKMDKFAIFDNYVILHYDPENKATKLTEAERKKKEDPILFGVIDGSRRLYHLYSWKDQYCDLTFDQLIDKYPEDIKPLE